MISTQAAAARRIHFAGAIWSGLIAGLVFLMIEMTMLMMMGQSPWGPPRMMGAIVLGPDALPPPASFDMGAVGAAMLVHFPLSVLYAFILGLALERLSLGPPFLPARCSVSRSISSISTASRRCFRGSPRRAE